MLYRSRWNLWEIPVKATICITFTKSNLPQVFHMEFVLTNALLYKCTFSATCFNDYFCPYGMKSPSSLLFFCSSPTNSTFKHFFCLKKTYSYSILSITYIFCIFYYTQCSLWWKSSYFLQNASLIFILVFLCIFTFLLCHGDTKPNPGPKRLKPNYLSICHWNLNSISAHKFQLIKSTQFYL